MCSFCSQIMLVTSMFCSFHWQRLGSETNINIDVTSIICDQIGQIDTCMTSNEQVESIQIDILLEFGSFHNK